MKRYFTFILLLLFLSGSALAQDEEAYTRVLDKLTAIEHFSGRPVLFIIGFDTSKSMSVEFDRSKKLTQTILSRYAAPGDSVYIFGFADKPAVLGATSGPQTIAADNPDKQIATLNESLLGLPRSSAQGTIFGRAKLYALEKAREFGAEKNTVVLLFSDNYSEIDMGKNELDNLKKLEKSIASRAETVPLYSQGVSPLWLTYYTNSFPNPEQLKGPDGEIDLENPRLAWAARRVGSQTLEFIAPATDNVGPGSVEVVLQFLGSSNPQRAKLTVNGKNEKTSDFEDGRATFLLEDLKPGSNLLFAQAVLADGKVRTAEKEIRVGRPAPQASPTPPGPAPAKPAPSPLSTPGPELPKKEGGVSPFVFLLVALTAAAALYFLSNKSIRVRVIGPDSEESYLLLRGKVVRLGGNARVESDLVFSGGLAQTIASVKCQAFGKARVYANEETREGTVVVETDEGFSVGATGEALLTSATVTYTNERGHKQVFTLVKEDASGAKREDSGHFGGEGASSDDDSDWRS